MSDAALPKQVLSIQSSVAYGHVGNSAAVFPLQRLGLEAWAVNTVHFSNHTGYGEWRGPLMAAGDLREVITGITERGALTALSAVLSGYQGAEEVGAIILETVAAAKQASPGAIYCCDPVMGDVGRGFFVRPGIPEFMRDQVVPQADVITPNHFELEFLADRPARTRDDVLAAVDAVRSTGPSTVLVTSVLTDDVPEGEVDVYVVDDEGAWSVRTPLLPIMPNGCGDATAAIFLAHLIHGASASEALARVTSSIFAMLETTVAAGTREIQLIAAQDAIAHPDDRFAVTRIR